MAGDELDIEQPIEGRSAAPAAERGELAASVEELVADIRRLREHYQRVVASIDEALAGDAGRHDQPARAADADPGASGIRLTAVNMALAGWTREQAENTLTELHGEADYGPMLDDLWSSSMGERPRRRRFLRRTD